jgi:hypothetical protein
MFSMSCVRIFGHHFVQTVERYVHCVRKLGHIDMIRNTLLIIGTLLPLVSGWVYIVSILRGVSKPQRMTRLLLAIITGLSFFALWIGGDTSGVWLALASFVESAMIYGLSFKYGMGGRDRLDIACMLLCIIGLIAWWVTGESLVGLIVAIAADCIAIVPSLVKTWRLPHTESWLFYALGSAAGIAIVAAGPHDLIALLFPGYIFLINAVFVLVILRGPLLRGLGIAPTRGPAKRTDPSRYRQTYEPDSD